MGMSVKVCQNPVAEPFKTRWLSLSKPPLIVPFGKLRHGSIIFFKR
jgi:hypothetical protein